jgi:hypothetical protein
VAAVNTRSSPPTPSRPPRLPSPLASCESFLITMQADFDAARCGAFRFASLLLCSLSFLSRVGTLMPPSLKFWCPDILRLALVSRIWAAAASSPEIWRPRLLAVPKPPPLGATAPCLPRSFLGRARALDSRREPVGRTGASSLPAQALLLSDAACSRRPCSRPHSVYAPGAPASD